MILSFSKRKCFTKAQKEREIAGVEGGILWIEILEKGGFTRGAASLRAFVVVRIIDPARSQLSIAKGW